LEPFKHPLHMTYTFIGGRHAHQKLVLLSNEEQSNDVQLTQKVSKLSFVETNWYIISGDKVTLPVLVFS
jgi:hypothetical protein